VNEREFINALLDLPTRPIVPVLEAQHLPGAARFDMELAATMKPYALERLVEMGAPVPFDVRMFEVDAWLQGCLDRKKRGLASASIARRLCRDYEQNVDDVRNLAHADALALLERLEFERARPAVVAKQRAQLEALLGVPNVTNTAAKPEVVKTLREQLGRAVGLEGAVAGDVADDGEVVAWAINLATREERDLADWQVVLELVEHGVDPAKARLLSRGDAAIELMQRSVDRCEQLTRRNQ